VAEDRLPPGWGGSQAYGVEAGGKQLTLVPFADAQEFRVWLARQ
jgi:hypothetical protein